MHPDIEALGRRLSAFILANGQHPRLSNSKFKNHFAENPVIAQPALG
jgi:hypothetical protein